MSIEPKPGGAWPPFFLEQWRETVHFKKDATVTDAPKYITDQVVEMGGEVPGQVKWSFNDMHEGVVRRWYVLRIVERNNTIRFKVMPEDHLDDHNTPRYEPPFKIIAVHKDNGRIHREDDYVASAIAHVANKQSISSDDALRLAVKHIEIDGEWDGPTYLFVKEWRRP